jgi:hypothetical protein
MVLGSGFRADNLSTDLERVNFDRRFILFADNKAR